MDALGPRFAAPRSVVAVDVGTSAVRAAVLTEDGTVRSAVRVARSGVGGGETFDAEAMVAEVMAALGRLEGAGGAGARGVSAHIGAVAVDAGGAVLHRAVGWADQRGLADLERLEPSVRGHALRRSGRPAVVSSALGLAVALAREPRLAGQVRHLLSPTGLLVQRLTGVAVSDSVNAAYTLLSDVTRRAWDGPAAAALGVDPTWLPPQAAPTEVVGGLTEAAASRCGLRPGLPVVAGAPDGSVGAGLLLGTDTSRVADVAGTTDVLARLIERPTDAPPRTVLNPALIAGRWTAGGPTGMTGGAVARWRALLQPVSEAELEAVPAGAGGLLVLPALTGSRFPRWDAGDRGAVLGQRPEHGPADLLRAAQEGAAYTVREAIDLLDLPGEARCPVVLAGGTARSRAAAQLRTDVLGRSTLVSDEPDVTLLGAAALALVGAGLDGDLDDARRRLGITFSRLEPDPARSARYDQLYEHWRQARDRVGAGTEQPSR